MSFLVPPRLQDLLLLTPELILMLGAMLVVLVEMFRPRSAKLTGGLAVLVLAGALASLVVPLGALRQSHPGVVDAAFLSQSGVPGMPPPLTAFYGNVVVDGFALTMKGIILLGSLISVVLGLRYAERFRNPGEFFALLLFATVAAALLPSAGDLLMIYLCVEFLSLASYIAVGYLKFQPRSTEAALKYFLFGAVTAAVMLYGMSLLYGMTGTLGLYAVSEEYAPLRDGIEATLTRDGGPGVVLIAMVLVAAGFGFKTAMAPFHQWVPDVYDGAPLPVMAWLSVVSKAAGVAVFVRVFILAFRPELWVVPIAVLAALTMTFGNLAALGQNNIKRMLAYSSIAHAGYTLMGLCALGQGAVLFPNGAPSAWQNYSIPVYLATYVFMNLGALAVVTAVYNRIKSHRIDDYAGLSQRAPGLAWMMLIFLLSLAGIPPTAGFWAKFVLFFATVETGLLWLAVVAFINTVISVYYYWNVVRAMFLSKPVDMSEVRPSLELRITLGVAALATVLIFIFIGPFMSVFNTR